MKNILKFLLYTICYTVIFINNGYNIDNNNKSDTINLVIENNQLKQEYNFEISDVYEKYDSLKQIVSNEFTEYISNNINDNIDLFDLLRNKYYIANLNNEYNFFIKKHTNQSKEFIERLANILLQDNLNCLNEYSARNSHINCLFVSAWNILAKYARCNNMNDSYITICTLIPKLGKKNKYLCNVHDEFFCE